MKKILLAALLIICGFLSRAQNAKEIDDKLVVYMDRIGYWGAHSDKDHSESNDSISNANSDLEKYLSDISQTKPLDISFPKAQQDGLTIVTSDDNKIRIYTWDTWMGGTMTSYGNVVAYQTRQRTKIADMRDTSDEGGYGSYYSAIITVPLSSGKTVYLFQNFNKASSRDRAEGIDAYTIENDLLKKYNVFKTKTKSLNSIGYGYNAFASDTDSHGNIPTIHLSNDKRKLYIPIVNGEKVTNKYLVYVFDGNDFVFDKNAK